METSLFIRYIQSKVRMPRKVKEPPRVVFTNRKINVCELEKSRPNPNKEWISELNALEKRILKFINLDIGRLNKICDNRGELERLCIALDLKIPLEETGKERDFSMHNFPEIRLASTPQIKKRSAKTRKRRKTISTDDDEDESSSTSSDLQNDKYRKTLIESAMVKASQKKEHVSPYKVEWSDEDDENFCFGSVSPSYASSENESLETNGSFSTDLIVNPAYTQTTEFLEPLEDARSPYQKFFSKTPKEIREHIERMSRKKFHSFSEKCIDEFVKFLEEKNIRSSNITNETLNNLFDIEIETPAQRAFTFDPKELPSVPKEIAEIYKEPHSSKRAALHQQIIWDSLYEENKPQKTVFGKLLPKGRKTWKKNTRESWFFPPDVDWDLITGHDFWKDLLHTEILEGFGKWLLENPQHHRPEYLVKVGFFEHIKKKIEKESAQVALPFKNEKEFEKILGKLNHNLSLDDDEKEFKKLPRYEELKKAGYHLVSTKKSLEEYNNP